VARASGFALEGIKRSAISRGDGAHDDAHLHARLATDPDEVSGRRPTPPVEIVAGAYQLCVPDPDLDAAAVLQACRDPGIQLYNPGPSTLDEAYAWCRGRADWSEGTHASWLVKDTAGALVGAVSIFQISERSASGQAGYWVAAAARGRGVATAALSAATRFGFGALDLVRVELFHAVENEASCRTALAAGFPQEGVHRQSYRYGDGVLRDEHSHARLAAD
jgi:RimJ/RimL family protein N-acetyltransferase